MREVEDLTVQHILTKTRRRHTLYLFADQSRGVTLPSTNRSYDLNMLVNNIWRHLYFILVATSVILPICFAGRNNKSGGGNRLMELLTAGIVAKVLQQKDEGHGGEGHGGGYYTVPVPLPMGSQKSHTHVTEKIIPIPVPHHTTRIIHINAGSEHESGGGGGGGFGSGGGGYDHIGGGYGDLGGASYGESNDVSADIGGSDHHHDDDSRHKPSIQQLLFTDGGAYGNPYRPPNPHAGAMIMRRPAIGLPTHPIPSMNMMFPPHAAVSAAHLHPVISATHIYPPISPIHRYPAMPSPAHLYPAVAGSNPNMVRVRHYYPLASNRHKTLAYPSVQQPRYQPQLMMQQNRYPRLW